MPVTVRTTVAGVAEEMSGQMPKSCTLRLSASIAARWNSLPVPVFVPASSMRRTGKTSVSTVAVSAPVAVVAFMATSSILSVAAAGLPPPTP